jgi:2-oxoglutarate dehydrogenase E2 component (dihydrolipoamide succinyltransferase)
VAKTDADAAALSPAVRRAVLEYGIDPATVKGTGAGGRLTKEDVMSAAQAKAATTAPIAATVAASVPAAPAAGPARNEERVKMTRLRQTIAKRLKSAQDNAALLTTFNDVDMSAVMTARDKFKDAFEKKHGIKLGFMSFFAKASCLALKDIPSVNARIEGDEIIYHDYVDISVAVSAPNGLVVPVVRDCDKLSFAGIESAIANYGKKARDGTLTMEDMKGGTFTISNGGVFGGLMSTPIINPPQSAVLGLHRIEDRPVVRGGQIVIRPMMYIALSYDHRLIDGREAVTALKTIKEAIEEPTRLLIDL